jgi:DtxR family Mn-dependent transcriptional regulator
MRAHHQTARRLPGRPRRRERGLSSSTEHYLRAILELRLERGYARVVDIATRVGVTKGTVSLALGGLARRRLVRFDAAHFPLLTPLGQRVAADVRGRHAIVRTFLAEILGVPPERAAAEACRWEHVISHEVADRLLDLLRFGVENAECASALTRFRAFHRPCVAGPQCNTCAVHGPVEAYCPEAVALPLPSEESV